MIRLPAHPLPPSPPSKLPLFLSLPECRRSSLLTGEVGEVVRRGAKSYDREKAWPSINHSILSALYILNFPLPLLVQYPDVENIHVDLFSLVYYTPLLCPPPPPCLNLPK
jgi:hypothetical protein